MKEGHAPELAAASPPMEVVAPAPSVTQPPSQPKAARRTREKGRAHRGLGRVFKRGEVYRIAYCYRGKEYRESAHSTNEAKAIQFLKKRIGEIGRGRLVGPTEERVTFEELAADFLRDRAIKWGEESALEAEDRLAHLRRFFGLDRALDITMPRIRAYIDARLKEGASPATVNRDLGVLGRMFSIAVEAGRLSTRPHMPRLQEAAPRQGFFEHSEYLAVREHLRPEYQDLLDFGYLSGWRRKELERLEWREVDREAGIIRLRPDRSKNGEGRKLALSAPLRDVIERRWRSRALGCPFVFHIDGKPVGNWRKSWKSACKAAGLQGKLFHDLRRTVARNLTRAGVPETVAMKITGHKTRSVFDRYNITSEEDLRRATARLAEYVAKQPASPTVVPLATAAESGPR
jgi:integrase